MIKLLTARLELVAGTPALVEAEMRDRQRLSEILSARIPDNWPPSLNDKRTMNWCLHYFKKHPNNEGWVNWYFVLRNDDSGGRSVIGNGGFRGRPDAEGTVEIGYSILGAFQNLGYATEAVRALLEWAFSHAEIQRIFAETYPKLKKSIRVLEKNGFSLVGAGSAPGIIRYQAHPRPMEPSNCSNGFADPEPDRDAFRESESGSECKS